MATTLAESESADVFVCQLSALLHDVDDRKLSADTAENLDNARSFLSKQGVDKKTENTICTIIRQISFKGTDSVVPDTLEGKCVQDADRLDALGAVGIARAFAYGGAHHRAMHNPEIKPNLNMNEQEYFASEGTTINHFYEKLFLLKDMINTESAKKIALQRDAFMRQFVDEFMSEWDCD